MFRRALLLVLLALIAFTGAAAAQKAEYAVVIVIDGARPEYFQNVDTPNMDSLAAAGVTYKSAWVGHLVNNTPPGHAVIATGCFPKRTGVLHFSWRNPVTGKMMSPTREPFVSNGDLASWMQKAGCPMIADFVKKRWPDCKTAAVGSAKYYAVASLGGASADCVLYAARTGKKETAEHGTAVEEGPHVVFGPKGRMAPKQVLQQLAKLKDVGSDTIPDTWAGQAAVATAEALKPRLMFVNLPQTDHVGHLCGGVTNPERMAKVIANVDVQIGHIVQAYKDLGVYDRTEFVITADHAMLPNIRELRTDEQAKVAQSVGAEPAATAGGPYLWLDTPEKSGAVAKALVESEKPLITAGYRRVRDADGFRYELVADSGLPQAVRDAQLYLLSTFACGESPDAAVFWAEDTVPLKPKQAARGGLHGDHTIATWHTQAIPMIFSGAGIAKGVQLESPARLVDIGPTVLAAMGIEPKELDGMVLADALAVPTAEQSETQKRESVRLAAYRDALRAQSAKETAELRAGPK